MSSILKNMRVILLSQISDATDWLSTENRILVYSQIIESLSTEIARMSQKLAAEKLNDLLKTEKE